MIFCPKWWRNTGWSPLSKYGRKALWKYFFRYFKKISEELKRYLRNYFKNMGWSPLSKYGRRGQWTCLKPLRNIHIFTRSHGISWYVADIWFYLSDIFDNDPGSEADVTRWPTSKTLVQFWCTPPWKEHLFISFHHNILNIHLNILNILHNILSILLNIWKWFLILWISLLSKYP